MPRVADPSEAHCLNDVPMKWAKRQKKAGPRRSLKFFHVDLTCVELTCSDDVMIFLVFIREDDADD